MKIATDRVVAWAWNSLFFALLLALVAGIALVRLSPDSSSTTHAMPARQNAAPAPYIADSVGIPAGFMRAPSGALLPRFAALVHADVTVHVGPGESYPVAWVVKGGRMPVEVIAEAGNWLRIRDHEGEEGWVARRDISDQRLAMVAPWRRDVRLAMHDHPADDAPLAAWVTPGVVAEVKRCDGHWCRIRLPRADVTGWVRQEQLWGVYANEVFPMRRQTR